MPTPVVVPRSPFVPRTSQPAYSHIANSTRAELDQLGLTALRAMVDVEPYGSSDIGGDPSVIICLCLVHIKPFYLSTTSKSNCFRYSPLQLIFLA